MSGWVVGTGPPAFSQARQTSVPEAHLADKPHVTQKHLEPSPQDLTCSQPFRGFCPAVLGLWALLPFQGCTFLGSDPGTLPQLSRALGGQALGPDIPWPRAPASSSGPRLQGPVGSSEGPAQPRVAPAAALHSRGCCVTLGGSCGLA